MSNKQGRPQHKSYLQDKCVGRKRGDKQGPQSQSWDEGYTVHGTGPEELAMERHKEGGHRPVKALLATHAAGAGVDG